MSHDDFNIISYKLARNKLPIDRSLPPRLHVVKGNEEIKMQMTLLQILIGKKKPVDYAKHEII